MLNQALQPTFPTSNYTQLLGETVEIDNSIAESGKKVLMDVSFPLDINPVSLEYIGGGSENAFRVELSQNGVIKQAVLKVPSYSVDTEGQSCRVYNILNSVSLIKFGCKILPDVYAIHEGTGVYLREYIHGKVLLNSTNTTIKDCYYNPLDTPSLNMALMQAFINAHMLAECINSYNSSCDRELVIMEEIDFNDLVYQQNINRVINIDPAIQLNLSSEKENGYDLYNGPVKLTSSLLLPYISQASIINRAMNYNSLNQANISFDYKMGVRLSLIESGITLPVILDLVEACTSYKDANDLRNISAKYEALLAYSKIMLKF